MMLKRVWSLVTVAGVVVCVAACGTGQAPADGNDRSAPRVAEERASPAELFAGTSTRYVRFEEPVELASSGVVDVVLSGTVTGFERGPTAFADDPPGIEHVLMLVRPDRVVRGDVEARQPVEVALPAADQRPAEFAAAIPEGTRVALYLVAKNSDLEEAVSPAQRAGIWGPATPQGFIMRDESTGELLFPMDPALGTDGTTIRSVLPK